jgi:hypothetical protein
LFFTAHPVRGAAREPPDSFQLFKGHLPSTTES